MRTPTDLLTVTHDHRGDSVIVQVAGEVDLFTQPVLECALAAARAEVRSTSGSLAIDLTGVQFLSVSGLRLLLDTCDQCLTHRIPLRVIAAGTPVQKLLRVTGLDGLLDVRSDLDSPQRSDAPDPAAQTPPAGHQPSTAVPTGDAADRGHGWGGGRRESGMCCR